MSTRHTVRIGTLVLALCCSAGVFVVEMRHDMRGERARHAGAEERIIGAETEEHSHEDEDGVIDPFERELVELVRQRSPGAAFAALRDARGSDAKIATDCHEYTHVIGTAAYEKYGSFGAAMEHWDDLCGSGYIHSLLVGMLGNARDPAESIAHVCDGRDGFCAHGIGHGLMFFSRNDVPRALALCATLTEDGFPARCSEGVFMQNFEHDQAYETPYYYAEDPLRACRDEPFFKPACYHYAGARLAERWRTEPDVFSLCDASDEGYVAKCVSGMGAYFMAINLSGPAESFAFCSRAKSADARAACIDGLVSYHLVNFGSVAETEALCAAADPVDSSACGTALESRRAVYD